MMRVSRRYRAAAVSVTGLWGMMFLLALATKVWWPITVCVGLGGAMGVAMLALEFGTVRSRQLLILGMCVMALPVLVILVLLLLGGPWHGLLLVVLGYPFAMLGSLAWAVRELERRNREEDEEEESRVCEGCGYDLRATPHEEGPLMWRCPECGRER